MSVLAGLIAFLAASTAAFAAEAPETPDEAQTAERQPPPPAVTRHTVTAGGAQLDYKATAEFLTLRNDAGEATGRLFAVAYEAADTRSEERRVGKEGVRTLRSLWWPYHKQNNKLR